MPFHIRPFLTLPLAFWFLITLLVLSSGAAYAPFPCRIFPSSNAGFTGWYGSPVSDNLLNAKHRAQEETLMFEPTNIISRIEMVRAPDDPADRCVRQ
jgi:hypothetical protein